MSSFRLVWKTKTTTRDAHLRLFYQCLDITAVNIANGKGDEVKPFQDSERRRLNAPYANTTQERFIVGSFFCRTIPHSGIHSIPHTHPWEQ